MILSFCQSYFSLTSPEGYAIQNDSPSDLKWRFSSYFFWNCCDDTP